MKTILIKGGGCGGVSTFNNLVPSLSPVRKASVNYLDFTLAQETYDPNGEEYFV